MRHTFGTEFHDEQGDLIQTQQAMGHSQISSTMVYMHSKLVDIDPVDFGKIMGKQPEPEQILGDGEVI